MIDSAAAAAATHSGRMDDIVVYLLLAFVCNIQGKHEESRVSIPEMVEEINTLNVGYDWFILLYKS